MANEKRLIPFGEKVTLYDLPFGAMFAFGDDCIAVKSEYTCGNGLIESFILGSGEQFWGGANTAKEQNELMVQPLEIVDVDAVEVVRCKDCLHYEETLGKDSGKPCGYGRCVNRCAIITGIVYDEDFCSYGERRTDERKTD